MAAKSDDIGGATHALKCLACGAKTIIVAGPEALSERISELEALVDDLGTDPNPESEDPEAVIKRHHSRAWEWARTADDAAREERARRLENALLRAHLQQLEATRPVSFEDRRVLKAIERLSLATLRQLGAVEDVRELVALELSRRTAYADLDLPYYVPSSKLRATPLEELFDDLARATEAGRKAKQMTAPEREQRFREALKERDRDE